MLTPRVWGSTASNITLPYDPVYHRYGVYIRDIYPFLALRVSGKFKNLFIFEHHNDYLWRGGNLPSAYPSGPNHQFTIMGFKVDKLYYPYNPRTTVQQTWRSYFAKGETNWKLMDEYWRNFYHLQAKHRNMTSKNRYLSLFLHECRALYY